MQIFRPRIFGVLKSIISVRKLRVYLKMTNAINLENSLQGNKILWLIQEKSFQNVNKYQNGNILFDDRFILCFKCSNILSCPWLLLRAPT